MRAKPEAQQAAQELRKQGLSYREIMQQIPVSKGSVSLWCRDVALTEAQAEHLRQRKIEAGRWGRQLLMQLRSSGALPRRRQFRVSNGQEVSQIMQEQGSSRRRGSEQNYATYKTKPQFLVKSPLTPAEEQLRVAGTMLYWAEGRKTGCVVEFSNSEPRLIALFLTFLRRVCGIAESRLRIHVYAYVDQDINQLKNFWSQITGVPLEQFTKPFVRQLTPNVSRRKMRWGLVNVRYSDTRLLRLILQWGEEFAQSWAGA